MSLDHQQKDARLEIDAYFLSFTGLKDNKYYLLIVRSTGNSKPNKTMQKNDEQN
jgi:hypothetical protein